MHPCWLLVHFNGRIISTNRDDGVPGGDGDDVGAGDDVAPARVVHRGLDAVDHLEAADRVHVRRRLLLAREEGRVVQQNGPVATLNEGSNA